MDQNDDLETELDIRASDYWCLFGIVLLYWDHILTFPAEVKYLWKRPRGISGYMFFFNRYCTALTNIIAIVSRLGPMSLLESPSCPALQKIRTAVLLVAQLIVLLILTMRIYVLYECNKRLLWILLFILTGWVYYFEVRRCHTSRDNRETAQAAIPWEAAFFYDTLIFSLAMYKAYQTKKNLGMKLPLMNIIIRDGSLYFGAISLANLANILTFYLAGPFMRTGLSTAVNSLSIALASRMMLHLHEIADIGVHYFPTMEGREIETRIQYYQLEAIVFSDDRASRE